MAPGRLADVPGGKGAGGLRYGHGRNIRGDSLGPTTVQEDIVRKYDAQRAVEAIKNAEGLSDSERVWKAIEDLAKRIDDTPGEVMDDINRALRF